MFSAKGEQNHTHSLTSLAKGDRITFAWAKRCDAKLNDDVVVGSAACLLVIFGWCTERTRSLMVQAGEFGIDGEETGFLNHFVEFLQYRTEIYSENAFSLEIRLGSLESMQTQLDGDDGPNPMHTKRTLTGHVHFRLFNNFAIDLNFYRNTKNKDANLLAAFRKMRI